MKKEKVIACEREESGDDEGGNQSKEEIEHVPDSAAAD